MIFLEKWEKKLRSVLARKKQTLERYSENVINRRLGDYPGGDQEYQGFRTAILYMQLSPEIDTEIIKKTVTILKRFIRSRRPNVYATLFLNNSEGKLMHPRSMLGSTRSVNDVIDEYYKKFAYSNQGYSDELNQLFPLIDPYSRKRYPSREDICLVFYGKQGLRINKKILNKVTRLQKRWIWIYTQKGDEVRLSFNKIPEEFKSVEQQDNELEKKHAQSLNTPDDFYLYKKEYGTWQGNNEVEIKSNGEVVIPEIFENRVYRVPVENVDKLWKRLLELRVFGLREKYEDPSVEYVMDGTSWELIVKGGGRSIQSEGHNKFPEQWEEIDNSIKECVSVVPPGFKH